MKLTDVVPPIQIVHPLRARSRRGVLRELLRRIARVYTAVSEDEVDELVERLEEREELGSTVLESGVAVPHVYHSRFHHLVAGFGICPEGIEFDKDAPPVRALFVLLVPQERTDIHMVAMSKLSALVQETNFMPRLLACSDADQVHDLFDEMERT